MRFSQDECYMTCVRELRARFRRRGREVGALVAARDGDGILRRGGRIRQALLRHLSDPDIQGGPLDPVACGGFDFGAYRIEKLHIAGAEGIRIPINLYLPGSGAAKHPAAIIGMGHWYAGKALESNQRLCANLAAMGIAAITFDPLFQGERCPCSREQLAALFGPDSEDMHMVDLHMLAGNPAYMLGKNLAGLFVFEMRRVLDCLCAREEIDAGRIAAVGQSGGGTQSCYLAAADDRVGALVPIQCLSRLSQTLEDGIGDCEQSLAGICAEEGVEQGDLLWASLEKPMLHCAGSGDFFAIEGVRAIEGEMEGVCAALGVPDRYRLRVADCGHELTAETRGFVYDWLAGRFHLPAIGAERDIRVLSPEALACLDREAPYVSPLRVYGAQLARLRSARPASDGEVLRAVRRLLGEGRPDCRVEPLPPEDGWTRFEIHVAGCRSALCRLRTGPSDRLAVIVAPERFPVRVEEGASVLRVAPWAIEASYRKAGMAYDLETCLFNISATLGECIARQRAHQLVAAVDHAASLCGAGRIRALGAEAGALTVLLAACLDERLDAPTLCGCPVSLDDLFDRERHFLRETDILPGLAACADLPRLFALTHARIINPVHSDGSAYGAEEAEGERRVRCEVMPPEAVRL